MRGVLGCRQLNLRPVSKGIGYLIKVVKVKENSAAERAGLKVGDIITQVDGQLVTLSKQLTKVLDVDRKRNAQ